MCRIAVFAHETAIYAPLVCERAVFAHGEGVADRDEGQRRGGVGTGKEVEDDLDLLLGVDVGG